jgi:hypothetical protein
MERLTAGGWTSTLLQEIKMNTILRKAMVVAGVVIVG